MKEKDPLYDEAVRIVTEEGKASTSLIQRKLKISYLRATNILAMMEENKIVGSANGAKPREILPQMPVIDASAMVDAIQGISRAMKVIDSSRLKRDTILTLIKARTGIDKSKIDLVLNNLEDLENYWLKPQKK